MVLTRNRCGWLRCNLFRLLAMLPLFYVGAAYPYANYLAVTTGSISSVTQTQATLGMSYTNVNQTTPTNCSGCHDTRNANPTFTLQAAGQSASTLEFPEPP